MELVAIALGSNLGQRDVFLQSAVDALREHLASLRVSPFLDTAPVGVSGQPRYLNGAVVGTWPGSADALLAILLAIEARNGRQRPSPGASRTLDLDLILFGDRIVDRAGLVVPHPRFRERDFVLRPLMCIAPDMRDPCSGLTVAELYRQLKERTP